MKPKVLEEIPIRGALSVWEELGVTSVPMGRAVLTHQKTREEYAVLLPMVWLCG